MISYDASYFDSNVTYFADRPLAPPSPQIKIAMEREHLSDCHHVGRRRRHSLLAR
jgi:hypothetical protein